MSKQIIHTDKAPAAIGAYSQAVRAGNTVWISGQIPLDPATGEVVAGGFAEQTEQVFKNLAAVIEAAGGTFDQMVFRHLQIFSQASNRHAWPVNAAQVHQNAYAQIRKAI